VSCSAIRDRTWVILRGVGLGAHGAGVVAGSAALCWVPKGLAFVALGGGAEGDVFGDGAFSVEHREAGSTKGLLGHLPNKGDDHGGSLLALAAFRAGEPSWCLSHSEGRVVGLNFCADGFGVAVVGMLLTMKRVHRWLILDEAIGNSCRASSRMPKYGS